MDARTVSDINMKIFSMVGAFGSQLCVRMYVQKHESSYYGELVRLVGLRWKGGGATNFNIFNITRHLFRLLLMNSTFLSLRTVRYRDIFL